MQIRKEGAASPKKRRVSAVADALRRIVQALRVSSSGIEKDHGVSGAQLFAMQQLSGARAMSIAELALRTRTDPSSVSVVVRRLAARGLVRRGTSPADGRRAEIGLTGAGQAVVAIAPEPAQARLLAALDKMSPAELGRLGSALGKLVRELDVSEGAPPMFFEDAPRHRPRRAPRHV
jgi:DNA-binding MarR family transcriptional regulator